MSETQRIYETYKIIAAVLLAVGIGLALSPVNTYPQAPVPGQQVVSAPIYRATTNGSATISSGNAFQSIVASIIGTTSARQSLTIQNNNTNGDNCWVYVGANASATKATAILLGQGGSYQRYYPYVPPDNISATCATTSDTLYLDTQ